MGVGAVYRLTLIQELLSQQVENVLHFRSNILTDSGESLAQSFDAFLTASWRLAQSVRVKYKLIKVQRADGEDDLVFEMPPTTLVGGYNGEAHPNQIAALLSVRSNTTSRRKNGRIYIAGPPAFVVDPFGKLGADEITRFTTLATAIMTTYGGNPLVDDYSFGVWSRPSPVGEVPVREGMFTQAQTIRVNAYYATQRRRQIGVGA